MFYEKINSLCKELQKNISHSTNEENTKNYLIIPFLNTLGYSHFNPTEFEAEYTVDIGVKKGEKVDYVLKKENEPIILVEAKSTGERLDNHYSQLYRYFKCENDADFAILTNGKEYRFYSDFITVNRMDKKPFFVFDISNFSKEDVEILNLFTKDNIEKKKTRNKIVSLGNKEEFSKKINEVLKNKEEDFIEVIRKYIVETKNVSFNNPTEEKKIIKKALSSLQKEKTEVPINAPKEKIENKPVVYLPLFSIDRNRNKHIPIKSGLNFWNENGKKTNPNKVYIPVPSYIRNYFSNFFPKKNSIFYLNLPNKKEVTVKLCQDKGKALMSNPQSDLGEWLLRDCLELLNYQVATFEHLNKNNVHSVKIEKIDNTHFNISVANLEEFTKFKEIHNI